MNIEDLEENLKHLGRQIAPSEDFVQRTLSRLPAKISSQQAEVKQGRVLLFLGVGALAAGVVLAVGVGIRMGGGEGKSGSAVERVVVPVDYERSSSRWAATVQQPVIVPGEVPAFEYRQQEFERVQLTDPTSHATLERVVPRDAARLIVLESY